MTIAQVGAFGAVGDGTTDDTAAINAAINHIRPTGGIVEFEAKPYLATSINATNLTGVHIRGVMSINGRTGTRILPGTRWQPTLDLAGSGGVRLENLQIGGDEPTGRTRGQCAIFIAPTTYRRDNISIHNVHVAGEWSSACLYVYGANDSEITFSRFWKFGGGAVAVFTRDNVYGLTSPHADIATGYQPLGNWTMRGCQFHDFDPSGAATSGLCIWLRGAPNMAVYDSLLDSCTTAAGTVTATNVDGTPSTLLAVNNSFYSETPGRLPIFNYSVDPGSLLVLGGWMNRYSHSVARAQGTVSVVQLEA